jgi:hypothetical protein
VKPQPTRPPGELRHFPGTPADLLEEALGKDLEGLILIEVPRDGSPTVSWSSMPLTQVCYLEKVFSTFVAHKLYEPEA